MVEDLEKVVVALSMNQNAPSLAKYLVDDGNFFVLVEREVFCS